MNDIGLFLSRVAIGAGMAAHGAQKAFGAFDGPGPQGAAQFLQSLGFVPGERFAKAASWTEMGSGALMVLGAGGALGPAALISTMLVAQKTVHAKNGFFAQKNGVELGVIYAAGALALASAGFGRYSVDEALGWNKLREGWLTSLALAGGITAGLIVLSKRTATPAPAAASSTNGVSHGASVHPEAAAAEATETQERIAAAEADRPVPADLQSASEDNGAPQT